MKNNALAGLLHSLASPIVLSRPAMSMLSLTENGTPCKGPIGLPVLSSIASNASASFNAASYTRPTACALMCWYSIKMFGGARLLSRERTNRWHVRQLVRR